MLWILNEKVRVVDARIERCGMRDAGSGMGRFLLSLWDDIQVAGRLRGELSSRAPKLSCELGVFRSDVELWTASVCQ